MDELTNHPEQLTTAVGDAGMTDIRGQGAGPVPPGLSRRPRPVKVGGPLGLDPDLPDLRSQIEEEVRVNPLRSGLIILALGFMLGRLIR